MAKKPVTISLERKLGRGSNCSMVAIASTKDANGEFTKKVATVSLHTSALDFESGVMMLDPGTYWLGAAVVKVPDSNGRGGYRAKVNGTLLGQEWPYDIGSTPDADPLGMWLQVQ